MEKYILIASIILFFIQKAYWIIYINSLSIQEQYRFYMQNYGMGVIQYSMVAVAYISYLGFIISGILYIIKYL